MNDPPQTDNASSTQRGFLAWTLAALVVAVVGAAGSLWLSIGMGLVACPLCLYQRTFILAVVGILIVGLLAEDRHTDLLNALALPAAMGGLGVAVFHEYLELTGKLECPAGILGLGTAPQQSLAIFVALLIVLAGPLLHKRRSRSFAVTATGLALGVAFAFGTIQSAPPLPSPPDQPYEQPLQMCRPPYEPENGQAISP
jgi:disulfide bond formation protein DsbB